MSQLAYIPAIAEELNRNPGQTLEQLAEKLGIHDYVMAGLLGWMECQGMIRKLQWAGVNSKGKWCHIYRIYGKNPLFSEGKFGCKARMSEAIVTHNLEQGEDYSTPPN
jgi:hypothetical protein